MTKICRVREILYDLQYQFPAGITTWGHCFNSCGSMARGGRVCRDCLTHELGQLVGEGLANRHLEAMTRYQTLRNDILEAAEESPNPN